MPSCKVSRRKDNLDVRLNKVFDVITKPIVIGSKALLVSHVNCAEIVRVVIMQVRMSKHLSDQQVSRETRTLRLSVEKDKRVLTLDDRNGVLFQRTILIIAGS